MTCVHTRGLYQCMCNGICAKFCGRGTFSPLEGMAYCFECPLGRYTNLTGQHECQKCECNACNPPPKEGENVNVIVDPTKTTCTQASPNFYSVDYDGPFKKCPCAKPSRLAFQTECTAPLGYTVAQRKALANACTQSLTNIVGNWTNGTQIVKADPDETPRSDVRVIAQSPSTMDWVTILGLASSLLVIFFSLRFGGAALL